MVSSKWQIVQSILCLNPCMLVHFGPTICVWWMDLYRYSWMCVLRIGLVVLCHSVSSVSTVPLKSLRAQQMASSISIAYGGLSLSLILRIPLYVVAWLRAASLAPCIMNSFAMARSISSGIFFLAPAFASRSLSLFPSLLL